METEVLHHPFPPVFDSRSRVLILGTMPSPVSRKQGFYYGHPQNTFWKVLAAVLEEPFPSTPEERRALVLARGIALWDVLSDCRIRGAEDSSIREARANDLSPILEAAPIQAVFTTGKKATEYYTRLILPGTGLEARYLPSTSPANRGRWSLEQQIEAYGQILPFLEQDLSK